MAEVVVDEHLVHIAIVAPLGQEAVSDVVSVVVVGQLFLTKLLRFANH